MRSPFADAKTIRDIGSYLPCAFGGKPYDREEHGQAAERWRIRSEAPRPPAVKNPEYFGNATFDSDILELEFAPDFVRVTVDLDDAYAFANALAFQLGLQFPPRTFPVDLFMHDPSLVRAVAHDDHGVLDDVEVSNRTAGGVLSNEWFFAHGDRLGWVVDTFGLDGFPGFTHLLIDCASASARDRRPETLVEIFGPAVIPLWQEARQSFRHPECARCFWDSDAIGEFLAERIRLRGWGPQDFRTS